MDERVKFIARFLEGEKVAALAREFGISRKTAYKIIERYQDTGLEGLTDRSRRPYSPASWTMIWGTSMTRNADLNPSTILSGQNCYLCLRNNLSPKSREGHSTWEACFRSYEMATVSPRLRQAL